MSKPFEELKNKHLNLLKRAESEIVVDEVRQFIEECRKAGRDISDPDERDYVRTNILRYWRNFLYSRTDTYPDIELEPPRREIAVDRLEALYHQGLEYFKKGEWHKAIKTLQEISKSDPGYKDASIVLQEAERQKILENLYVEGMHCYSHEDWQGAIEKFTQSLFLSPDYRDVKHMLIEAQQKLQQGESPPPKLALRLWWQAQSAEVKAALIGAIAGVLATLCGLLGGDTTLEVTRYLLGINPTPTVSVSTATSTSTLTPTPFIPTSTPYPAPALLSPDERTSFALGQDVKLQWKWERNLAEDEFFEVRIRLKGEPEFDPIGLTTVPYRFVPASRLAQAGIYEWQVAIVSLSGEEKGVSQIQSFEIQ